MTNKEILHADLLDILFENRNKAYGAYALRKNYNHRLEWALGISLIFVFLLSMLDFANTKKSRITYDYKELKVSLVELSEPKKPDLPKSTPPPKTRQIAYTDQIKIVPDYIKTEMPEQKEMITADISSKTIEGNPSTDTVQRNNQKDGKETEGDKKSNDKEDFHPTTSDAQFPGGKEAFVKFLTKYLITPGEFEAGEKKIVLVRFMVDAAGTISKTEVLQSDGEEYSREVIRVLTKMPKWIPAMQNGTKVATWFTQPVSFIGVE